MTVSLVLADDHRIVRAGLRALLEVEADFKVVAEAGDGPETVEVVERLRPDVLVLDLMMPGLGGLEVLRRVRQRVPQTRVVVLSMYADEAFVVEALRRGAAGYVLLAGEPGSLAAAIRAAMAGRRYLSPPLSERRIAACQARAESAPADPYETLTPRECEVFALVAEGHTNAEIAARLYISPRTVEMHRSHLMHKLRLRTRTDLVRYALRRGMLPRDA